MQPDNHKLMVMKKTLLSVVILAFLFTNLLQGQTIWNGATITFTKAAGADWTLPANQDRIISSTWITRANTMGIFNIASETSYTHNSSPANTLWATGTLANYASLAYQPWEVWAGGRFNIPSIVGKQAVLKLVAENIYISIMFTAWGGSDGGFAYERSTAAIPAPVKLVSFVATKKDNKLQLNWKTASEENTANFTIERSSDGKTFSSIGTIPAAGNSSSEKSYSFADVIPLPANFYRLKTNDNNGTFSYSSIVAFKFGKTKSLDFFPVPATNVLHVQLNVVNQSNLQIIDIAGRVIKTKPLVQGNNAFNLSIYNLKAGVYFLRVGDENKMFIKE